MKCHSHSETSTCLNLGILLIHLSLIKNILADSWITPSVGMDTRPNVSWESPTGKQQGRVCLLVFAWHCSNSWYLETLLSFWSACAWGGGSSASSASAPAVGGWGGAGQGLEECGRSTQPVRNPDCRRCRAPGFLAQVLSVRQSPGHPLLRSHGGCFTYNLGLPSWLGW